LGGGFGGGGFFHLLILGVLDYYIIYFFLDLLLLGKIIKFNFLDILDLFLWDFRGLLLVVSRV
jgi:hypothetical protein